MLVSFGLGSRNALLQPVLLRRYGFCRFRDNFEAENSAEAKAIAGAICDACADEHHSHELWKGDLPIESSETSASESRTQGLSAAARKIAQDRMIALRNSSWPVNRSRRLGETIAAWALGPAPVLRPSMIAGCASLPRHRIFRPFFGWRALDLACRSANQ